MLNTLVFILYFSNIFTETINDRKAYFLLPQTKADSCHPKFSLIFFLKIKVSLYCVLHHMNSCSQKKFGAMLNSNYVTDKCSSVLDA